MPQQTKPISRFSEWARLRLLHRLERVAKSRPADIAVWDGPVNSQGPFMLRWHIIPPNKLLNVNFHVFLASDKGDLHYHPRPSVSWILEGSYIEVLKDRSHIRPTGAFMFRGCWMRHRIELIPCLSRTDDYGEWSDDVLPVKTLFITGPAIRRDTPVKWIDNDDLSPALSEAG